MAQWPSVFGTDTLPVRLAFQYGGRGEVRTHGAVKHTTLARWPLFQFEHSSNLFSMAGPVGFEPTKAALEAAGLPLA